MKIKSLLIGMLACSAMVACTNTDEPEVEINAEGKAYVSVKLVSSSLNGSRSTTDGNYENANPAETENKIDGSKSIFLFYEGDGHWVTSGVITTETPVGTENPAINDVKGAATVVLQGTETNLSRIEKVLTVINYSGCDNLKQLTLEQALAKIAETSSDDAAGTKNGFLMTTSVYKNVNENNVTETINYTKIEPGNIAATAALAKANPVIIHVERAAAKVDVAVTATGDGLILGKPNTSNADKGIVVDGVITPVQITIDGWTLNGINEDTYLVKQLEDAWKVSGENADVPFANWNKATDFRSFWAKSTNYVNDNSLTYKTYTEAKESETTVEYCYENNYDNYAIDYNTVTKNHKVTTVLVAAHFNLLDGTNGAATAAQTLYEFNGVFYKEANYKNLILKQLQDAGYKVVTTTGGTTTEVDLTEAALQIKSNGTLSGIQFEVKAPATGSSYYKNNETCENTAIATFINGLDYVKEAQAYLNGQCYYQVPIEHLAATADELTYTTGEDGKKSYNFVEGFYGVIRNHHYKLNISAIKHIGEPVYDPNKKITDIPAKLVDYYMAAEIHVLNWKVVNQNVEL